MKKRGIKNIEREIKIGDNRIIKRDNVGINGNKFKFNGEYRIERLGRGAIREEEIKEGENFRII